MSVVETWNPETDDCAWLVVRLAELDDWYCSWWDTYLHRCESDYARLVDSVQSACEKVEAVLAREDPAIDCDSLEKPPEDTGPDTYVATQHAALDEVCPVSPVVLSGADCLAALVPECPQPPPAVVVCTPQLVQPLCIPAVTPRVQVPAVEMAQPPAPVVPAPVVLTPEEAVSQAPAAPSPIASISDGVAAIARAIGEGETRAKIVPLIIRMISGRD